MKSDDKNQLLGVWISDPNDREGRRILGAATLEFRPDGQLLYTVHEDDADRTAVLRYRLEDGWLLTDQVSAPRVERTWVKFTADGGALVLTYDGVSAHYIRRN